jgi:cell division protein FtsB
VVTPRILQTRRLGFRPAPAPARRRRSSARPLVEIATTAAAQRLQFSVFARVCAVSVVLLALAIAYLVVAAQATQNAYVLSQLKDQNAQLQAEQESLRYRSASLHGPAQTANEAAATGMQRTASYTTVSSQPVALDLQKPIGPDEPADSPPWQRAIASVFGSRDAAAAQP